jgi:hypothetical protein
MSTTMPVAVTLIAVLQYVLDDAEARAIIDTLMAPLVPGSMLALSTVTAGSAPGEVRRGNEAYQASGIPIRSRTHDEVAALFDRFELIDPGVTLVARWRPDDESRSVNDSQVYMYGGVARKPEAAS